MHTIIFDARKNFHDRGDLAYYHKDYPFTVFFTMEPSNRKMSPTLAIRIIYHESLHDVLTRRISTKASKAIDNKLSKRQLEKMDKLLQ